MLAEGLNPSYLLPRVILLARIYPVQSRVDIPLGREAAPRLLIAPFYNLNARNQEGSAAAVPS